MTAVTGAAARTPAALFGPTGPGERHAAYATLAATGPVHRVELPDGTRAWLVTGHDAVRAALTDPRLTKRLGPVPGGGLLPPAIDAAINSDLLHHDPPDHTRLRRLVSAAFTRRRVDALAPRIQQIADALLDDLAGQPEADLVSAFAYPLPITVISELLGGPAAAQQGFREWSTTLVGGSALGADAWVAAAMALVDYVRGLIAAKRADPADDLISALVAARDGTDRLTEDELVIPGLMAANRDPARVPDPDTFDPCRDDSPHLAFGHGVHHRLGAPLARLEGRIALGSLPARFPDLRLAVPAEDLLWRPSVLMHGLAALPVRLIPSPTRRT